VYCDILPLPKTEMTIYQKLQNFKELKKNLRVLAMDTLVDTAEEYKGYQIEQWLHGERNDGNKIGEYKDSRYADDKARLNPLAGGSVDLILNRDFSNELTLRRESDKKYLVYSQDWKMGKLVGQYGPMIFYLNPKYLLQFRSKVYMREFKSRCEKVVNGV
jgi:hypothetical protein